MPVVDAFGPGSTVSNIEGVDVVANQVSVDQVVHVPVHFFFIFDVIVPVVVVLINGDGPDCERIGALLRHCLGQCLVASELQALGQGQEGKRLHKNS